MGANANCCKQPESVIEEDKYNTVGAENGEEKRVDPRQNEDGDQYVAYANPAYQTEDQAQQGVDANVMNQYFDQNKNNDETSPNLRSYQAIQEDQGNQEEQIQQGEEQIEREEVNNDQENAEPTADAAGAKSLEIQANQVSAAEDANVEQTQNNNQLPISYGETKILPTITRPVIYNDPIQNDLQNYNTGIIGAEVADLYADQYNGNVQATPDYTANNVQSTVDYTANNVEASNYATENIQATPDYTTNNIQSTANYTTGEIQPVNYATNDYTTGEAQLADYTTGNVQLNANVQYDSNNVNYGGDVYKTGINTDYNSGFVEGGYAASSTTYAQPIVGGVYSNYQL